MKRPPRPDPPVKSLLERGQPWFLAALVALFVARPLWPSESAARAGDGLPLVLLMLLLAVAWLSAALVSREWNLRWTSLDLVVAALVGWNALAALVSATRDAPRPALNMLWEWISLGAAYFLARQFVAGSLRTRAVVVAMLVLATGLSAYGLYQYFVTMPDTRAQYAANPDAVLAREGLPYAPGSVERELFEQRLASTEPLSTFALANSLAGFLVPWLICAAGALLLAREMADRRASLFVAAGGTIFVVGYCLLLTKSRSAYLAVAAGIVLAILFVGPAARRWRGAYALAAVGLIVAALAIGFATGALDREVASEATKSLGYRWQYWQATAALIADHPLVGVGPGNFGDHYPRYKLATASEEITDPHNFLLELAATAGLPAALAMLVVLALLAAMLFRAEAPEAPGPIEKAPREASLVLGGAGLGVGLALALPWFTGPIIEAPLPLLTGLIVLAVGAGAAWFWWPWLRSGAFPARLASIAALALAINLLAAGGISFSAVAQSFWLLAAIAAGSLPQRTLALAQRGTLVAWLVALALFASCFFTSYLPVLNSQTSLFRAQLDPRHAPEFLRTATKADRAGSIAAATEADYHFRAWQATGRREEFETFQAAIDEALRRRPHQTTLWLRRGDGLLQGFRTLGERELLDEAIRSYERAVELYPRQARQHAKLALALDLAGRREAALDEARLALRYDAETPHLDQKLRPELRAELANAGLSSAAK